MYQFFAHYDSMLYYGCLSGWTDVTRGKPINFDQDTDSLEVKTLSENEKKTDLVVAMYTRVFKDDTETMEKIGYLHIRLEDFDTQYQVYHCDQEMRKFSGDMPDDPMKTWTITKTSTDLIIDFNGIRLHALDLKNNPSSECRQTWSQNADQIEFSNGGDTVTPMPVDTASQEYRTIEYEIFGEGSHISTNQKRENSAFSPLIG